MNIAFLTRSLEVGGTERQLVSLAAGLHARGHAVSVIRFYGGGPFGDELASRGVDVVTLEKSGRWDFVSFGRSLRRALRSIEPGILYSMLPVPNLVAAFSRMTIARRTALVWGVRSASMDLSHYDRAIRLTYAAEQRLQFLPDAIIANSAAAKQAWGGGAKISVVPNGIDVGRFTIDRDAGRRVRDDLGIAPAMTVIGNVGRLDPIKDHRTFLAAAARVATPNVRFLVVGGGDDRYGEAMKRAAAELGIAPLVIWAGPRSDMPAVYNALDLLVSSSSSEAFPNVVAEAMACGVPCIATDVGDCRRIVSNDEFLVPPRDPERLAAAIGRLLRSGGPVSAEGRRQHIVDSFSIDAMIDRTEDLLLRLRDSHDRKPSRR